jgi:Ca2+-binding RTX toxin-like protein
VVDNAGDRIVEGGGAGTDEVRTTLATYTLANHLENLTGLASTGQTLTGNNADNIITGGAGGDTLTGGNGDDILLGGDGDDFLYGNNGNDFLLGGAGADRLEGGNGDDRLVGGSGDDILEGGNGSDVLVGGAGNDVLTGGNGADVFIIGPSSGNDRITDFGNGDLIDWSAMTDAGFQATITQSGRDTVISFSDGSSVTLVGAGSPRGDWYEDGPLSSLAAELVTLGDDAARQSDWILAA